MSVEGQIVQNIRETLFNISGPVTYINTIRERQIEAADSFESEISEDAFPHFSIVFRNSTREKEPGRLKKILNIDIVASFESPIADEVEGWLSDIEKVLSIDITRGGCAYETWVPSMTRNSDVLDELQVYIINVEVRTLADFGTL